MIYPFLLEIGGLLFIYLEFFMPGGIMAMAGGILLLSSLILFLSLAPTPIILILFLTLLLLTLVGVCKAAMWQIRKRNESLSLLDTQEGFVASGFNNALIGKRGISSTDLKPSGYILIEGNPYQALSESGYVAKDRGILVVSGKGSYYIIREE